MLSEVFRSSWLHLWLPKPIAITFFFLKTKSCAVIIPSAKQDVEITTEKKKYWFHFVAKYKILKVKNNAQVQSVWGHLREGLETGRIFFFIFSVCVSGINEAVPQSRSSKCCFDTWYTNTGEDIFSDRLLDSIPNSVPKRTHRNTKSKHIWQLEIDGLLSSPNLSI